MGEATVMVHAILTIVGVVLSTIFATYIIGRIGYINSVISGVLQGRIEEIQNEVKIVAGFYNGTSEYDIFVKNIGSVSMPEDELYGKMISNIKEVSARNAFVVAVSSNKDVGKYADTVISIPRTHYLFAPFVSAVALQLLSYHTAKILGRKIDKPKNLAKTVTVE